jgi:hypothetical protein
MNLMIELKNSEFNNVVQVLDNERVHYTFAYAVVEGKQPGRIYADNNIEPTCCLIVCKSGKYLVAGDTNNTCFNEFLSDYLYDKENHKAEADLITLHDEVVNENEPYELFDPSATWKRKTISNFVKRELLVPIFKDGIKVYQTPNIAEIRKYCLEQINTIWDEVTRFENPHNYYVDLSQKLWDVKNELLEQNKGKI